MLRLINDIFDLSQIEAGTLNFEYSEFDANDLLRELEGMFKVKLFNNPSVDLICEDSVQSIIMYSERQRIIQVMANLIHNAIKFTKSGEIRFSCRMEGTDEVYFYVSDTGIGIPKEEQQEIFSSFKKLDREVPGMMICNLLHNLFFGELYRHLFAIVNLTKADLLFCEIFF